MQYTTIQAKHVYNFENLNIFEKHCQSYSSWLLFETVLNLFQNDFITKN